MDVLTQEHIKRLMIAFRFGHQGTIHQPAALCEWANDIATKWNLLRLAINGELTVDWQDNTPIFKRAQSLPEREWLEFKKMHEGALTINCQDPPQH